MSVSSPDGSDVSVGTPLSTTFTTFSQRKPSNPQIAQTPGIPTFTLDGMTLPTGGMHLFEADIHSPYSPGSPNPLAINAPIPLEPCPESYLLRPFWLMRCFYQTLAHPRGGYLSTKLFVPRDIWNVKGVKIKSVEEKISNIDLLTAALLKLGRVDTLDADATLEEMQALELVLDQVQSNLVKKLGSEVGTGGREVPDIEFVGPNANYMGSLTRLFDAVQVLDQIARQVEDPGLKHSSPTHVGLELSTRHAAEFFGFYICRFVLSDIAMMLDKFIKRGSEWVLI
ncbi:putative mit domain-containing protein [Diplodia seriata]|uniref:Putative mit domain-containing protein n=1 Tax=Diplodia seriata TaxID=420778 RepID=A0A0G2EWN4_9PEZI|nr:putative mit domain-containing protein [Diplodia seriata]